MLREKKDVMIPYDIFAALIKSYLLEDHSRDIEIQEYLEDKLKRIVQHDYYTTYKTSPNPQQAEAARQQYLDSIQMQSSFRW